MLRAIAFGRCDLRSTSGRGAEIRQRVSVVSQWWASSGRFLAPYRRTGRQNSAKKSVTSRAIWPPN
jgi:hypothetical protein